jgi:hypothetical protein
MEHVVQSPDEVAPVVHRAIESGVNYIDMIAWAEDGKDAFEAAMKGHRDDVVLAGHLGVAETDGQYRKSRDLKECEDLWHDWLSRMNTDHLDVIFLSNVDKPEDYAEDVGPGGALELALRLRAEGKARFIGLSGHTPATAVRAVEDGHIDILMHDINLSTSGDPDKAQVGRACVSNGVGLVVMKAFAGGNLLRGETQVSPSQCLSYALAQPGVSLALAGARNLEELEADLAILDASEEKRDFSPVIGAYNEDLAGTCVYCNHCMPCPSGIDIAAVLRLLTSAEGGITDSLRASYNALPARASDCIECDECTERCPFGVDVAPKMREAVETFGS